jgi:hypothetical protein
MMRSLLILLALSACACSSGRNEATANSAATVWEAADAIDKGVDPARVTPAIKANAAAIIHASGSTYQPAGVK